VGESFPPALGRIAMTVWRLNADGSPDQTFGNSGVAFVSDPGAFMYGFDVAIQRDGKILVCGRFHTGTNNDVAVVRLLSNGTLDSSFGNLGIVRTDISADDRANSLAIFEDGRVVIAGTAIVDGNRDFLVIAYTSTGALDTAFGATGIVTIPFAGFDDQAESIQILKSGDIIVGGSVVTETALVFGLAKLDGAGVPQRPWHNYNNPLNVDQDPGDNVSPIDALVVINELNAVDSHPVPAPDPHSAPRFYHDVNGDNFVSPIDALLVINELFAQSLAPAQPPASASPFLQPPAVPLAVLMAAFGNEGSSEELSSTLTDHPHESRDEEAVLHYASGGGFDIAPPEPALGSDSSHSAAETSNRPDIEVVDDLYEGEDLNWLDEA
jgi:uncharacterized delta-60 repeat protein